MEHSETCHSPGSEVYSLEELIAACQDAGTNLAEAQSLNSEGYEVSSVATTDVHPKWTSSQLKRHSSVVVDEFSGELSPGKKSSRKKNKRQWKKTINKEKRMHGEEFEGYVRRDRRSNDCSKTISRPARKLGPPCVSKLCQRRKSRYCDCFPEASRQTLFDEFWSMKWDEKRGYVKSHVDRHKSVLRTTPKSESRRVDTYCYFLKLNGKKRQVCKKMFLDTLGMNEKQVYGWINGTVPMGRKRVIEVITEKQKHLATFLDELPKLPSHYCRKLTSKLYLEHPFTSMRHLFRAYREFCQERKLPTLAWSSFFDTIKEKNIGLYKPKKDECDTCCGYRAGNISLEDYQKHLCNKELAREEKERDKLSAKSGNCHVITMDMQAVLLAPMLNASALYYKTKLMVHNFTMYDLKTRAVTCYLWDESQGDQVSSVFATCIRDFLRLYDDKLPIIMYSDGCTYQNRNANLSNALLDVSIQTQKIITQKFLEKGHTQMEVDSVHSAIERKLKNVKINVPTDYIDICASARLDPEPYTVKYLSHDFFIDFSKNLRYSSIRPGSKKGDPCVTDLRLIRYNPNGCIDYKLGYGDENDWKSLPRKPIGKKLNFPKLYPDGRRRISKRKFQDLMDILRVLPIECHQFYKSLPFE